MENSRRKSRWFVLFILLSSLFAWLLIMNQAFALHPKPECKVQALALCKNQPAMLGPTPSPTPISSIWGDAGDAPDGRVVSMTAYATPMVMAGFPTIYVPSTRSGPYHYYPETGAYLGRAVSQEVNANELLDGDTQTNISPTIDMADRDGGDDGLGWLYELEVPCHVVKVTYTVTVLMPNTNFYLNMWFDFDRDGMWGYVSPGCGQEWAVQNELVNPGNQTGVITGVVSFTTTAHTGAYQPRSPLWLRVTLAEQPATMPDGSGPPAGFLYGETEDYFLCRRTTAHSSCEGADSDPAAGWLG